MLGSGSAILHLNHSKPMLCFYAHWKQKTGSIFSVRIEREQWPEIIHVLVPKQMLIKFHASNIYKTVSREEGWTFHGKWSYE